MTVGITVAAAGIRAEYRRVLLQSDFGVKPLSVLGGLLSVQDAVIVEFKLSGETP